MFEDRRLVLTLRPMGACPPCAAAQLSLARVGWGCRAARGAEVLLPEALGRVSLTTDTHWCKTAVHTSHWTALERSVCAPLPPAAVSSSNARVCVVAAHRKTMRSGGHFLLLLCLALHSYRVAALACSTQGGTSANATGFCPVGFAATVLDANNCCQVFTCCTADQAAVPNCQGRTPDDDATCGAIGDLYYALTAASNTVLGCFNAATTTSGLSQPWNSITGAPGGIATAICDSMTGLGNTMTRGLSTGCTAAITGDPSLFFMDIYCTAGAVASIYLGGLIPSRDAYPFIFDDPSLRSFTASASPFVNSAPVTLPASISGISTLSKLYINYWPFTGHLPPLPSSMAALYVSNTNLSGSLPAALPTGLTYLNVAFNSFSGVLPSFPTQLAYLNIANNSFSGPLPSSINNTHLQFVYLGGNPSLSGSGVLSPAFSTSENYVETAMGDVLLTPLPGPRPSLYTPTTPPCPVGYASTVLDANGLCQPFKCCTPDQGATGFCAHAAAPNNASVCGALGDIYYTLRAGNVTIAQYPYSVSTGWGGVPTRFWTYAARGIASDYCNQTFYITGGVIGIFVPFCNNAGVLVTVGIQSGAGQTSRAPPSPPAAGAAPIGPLPSSFCNLGTGLQFIRLSGLGFTGSIPSCISFLSGVTYLDLEFNALTGSIPAALFNGSLPLKTLHLSSNALSGTLPNVTLPAQLVDLDLSANAMAGTIPAAFAASFGSGCPGYVPPLPMQFCSLQLQLNQLRGTMPTFQCYLDMQCDPLRVDGNLLTGTVPAYLQNTFYGVGGSNLGNGLGIFNNLFTGAVSTLAGLPLNKSCAYPCTAANGLRTFSPLVSPQMLVCSPGTFATGYSQTFLFGISNYPNTNVLLPKCSVPPLGSVAPGLGATYATPCAANTYALGDGMNCTSCPANSVSPAGSPNIANCTCALGYAQVAGNGGLFNFTQCSAGTFFNVTTSNCQTCASGFYSAAAAYSCTACPAGTVWISPTTCSICPSNSVDIQNHAACQCTPGYYDDLYGVNLTTPTCTRCPSVGAVCTTGFVGAAEGHWRESNTSAVLYACRTGACLKETVGSPLAPASMNVNVSGRNCAAGTTGPLCALCLPGYAIQSGQCLPCPASAAFNAWVPGDKAALVVVLLFCGIVAIAFTFFQPLSPLLERIWTGLVGGAAIAATSVKAAAAKCLRCGKPADGGKEKKDSSQESRSGKKDALPSSEAEILSVHDNATETSADVSEHYQMTSAEGPSAATHEARVKGSKVVGAGAALSAMTGVHAVLNEPDGEEELDDDGEQGEDVYGATGASLDLVYYLQRMVDKTQNYLKIAINFYQIVSTFIKTLDIPWPAVFTLTMSKISVINLNLVHLPKAACMSPNPNYYNEFNGYTLGLLAALVAMAAMWCFGFYVVAPSGLRGVDALEVKERRRKFSSTCLQRTLMLLYLVYPGVSVSIFGIFSCTTIGTHSWLNLDMSIPCYDSTWRRYCGGAIVWVFLVPVGVPLFFNRLLRRFRVPDLAALLEDNAWLREAAEHTWRLGMPQPAVDMQRLCVDTIGDSHLALLHAVLVKGVDANAAAEILAGHMPKTILVADAEEGEPHAGLIARTKSRIAEIQQRIAVLLRPELGLKKSKKSPSTSDRAVMLAQLMAWCRYSGHLSIGKMSWEDDFGLPEGLPGEGEPMHPAHASGIRSNEVAELLKRASTECGFLFAVYTTRCWYWESIELLRKLVLTSILALISPGSAGQVVVGCLVAFFALLGNMKLQPYSEKSLNFVNQIAQVNLFFFLFVALLLKVDLDGDNTASYFTGIVSVMMLVPVVLPVAITAYLNLGAFNTEDAKDVMADATF